MEKVHLKLENLLIEVPGFKVGPVSLGLKEGEFFVILGPTGSGKSLLLECIAGLVKEKAGKILLKGRDITSLPPERRRITIIYQDVMLFPHMNVRENITYGAKVRGIKKSIINKKLGELSSALGIEHLLEKKPETLSGGEAQRVALARSLMIEPDILLLDEPLSSLDQRTRENIGNLLKKINSEKNTTMMMVTHDIKEALLLSDRMAIMRGGKIEQIGKATEILESPRNEFVASFMGMKNVFPVKVKDGKAFLGNITIEAFGLPKEGKGYISIRPEDIVISVERTRTSARNVLSGTVEYVKDLGMMQEVAVNVEDVKFISYITKSSLEEMGIRPGIRVFVVFKASAAKFLHL